MPVLFVEVLDELKMDRRHRKTGSLRSIYESEQQESEAACLPH